MSYQQFFKVMSLPQPPSFQQYNYICIKYCPVVLDHLIVACCHELNCTLLYDRQFVPYCTTKYIFWLGKNKFDILKSFCAF